MIPNCMQLILQLGCSRLLLNEVPDNLYMYLLLCTRLKTLWVMEDKVASFICNFMFNIMYTSLTFEWNQWVLSASMYRLASMDGIKWVSQGSNSWPWRNRKWGSILGFHLCNLPFLSCIMMGFVPFSTPQTFSRMVVLPALALPMTRMRKWGHLYCSLSIGISPGCAATRDQSISFSDAGETIFWPTRCSCTSNLCHLWCFH